MTKAHLEHQTTKVNYNGSRWHGQEPASIDTLLALVQVEPLDWEMFGWGFVSITPSGDTHIAGNFLRFSHAFSIETSDRGLLAKFAAALDANRTLSKRFDMATPVVTETELSAA
jgi:hypothetical protein